MRAKQSNLFHIKEIASSLKLLAMTGGASDSVLPELIEKLQNLAGGQDIPEICGLGKAELLEILDIFYFILNMRLDYKRV